MNGILDTEKPDFVVLNGDLVHGDSVSANTGTHYVDQIVAPLVKRKLTWGSTYGNHDQTRTINGAGIQKREQMFPGARTVPMVSGGEKPGTSNYYLPVYDPDCPTGKDSNGKSCTPELLLWFFDSRAGLYSDGRFRGNWVDSTVVKWFTETSASLAKKFGKIPALAFVHIPTHASYAIQQKNGINKYKQPGINEEKVMQQGAGWCPDNDPAKTCEYGNQDLPFMKALVSTPGLIGVFSGHDHGLSWCYKWDSRVSGMDFAGSGINLCFGQHTGYGGYGNWIRGARQLSLTRDGVKKGKVRTHIRLESGEVVGEVYLNSTYNKDSYKATPNKMTYI